MPKPLFLHCPAGLYVRFRVPADLLRVVGSRFLGRPLKMVKGDRARLVAETMAVALSQSFDCLRKGEGVDLEKALDAARSAGSRDLTLGEVSLHNGTVFRNVHIDADQDTRQVQAMVDEASRAIASRSFREPAPVIVSARATPKEESVLSHQVAVHLGDLGRAEQEKKTVLGSRHALRLFVGIVGDNPAAELSSDDCRRFFDEVALNRAGVGHGAIARITGHGLSGGVLPKFCIDAPSLPERVEALGKFDAGVQIPVYPSGQFASSPRRVSKVRGKGHDSDQLRAGGLRKCPAKNPDGARR